MRFNVFALHKADNNKRCLAVFSSSFVPDDDELINCITSTCLTSIRSMAFGSVFTSSEVVILCHAKSHTSFLCIDYIDWGVGLITTNTLPAECGCGLVGGREL